MMKVVLVPDKNKLAESLESDPVYVVCLAENSTKSAMIHSNVIPQENIKVVE